MTIGKLISARRKVLRMTQFDLAVLIGVSKSAVAKWETDGGLPDRDNLRRIADVMEVSVDDLHRIIGRAGMKKADITVNITPEVISALESYGYKVIRPGEEGDEP